MLRLNERGKWLAEQVRPGTLRNAYLVLFVPGVGTVKELDGDFVVLVQPLQDEGLEPPAKSDLQKMRDCLSD